MGEIIQRSISKMDPISFLKLFKLCSDHYWLQDETDALVELWNFCDAEEERDLIQDLLNNFCFINSRDLKTIGIQVANQIVNKWSLSKENTLIVAISKNKDADGSQMFLQSIKDKFSEYDGWTETNFFNSLAIAAYEVKNNSRLVLLDDFIGSGNTIQKKTTWLRKILTTRNINNVEIYLVSIAMMRFSLEKLDSLKIIHYSPNILNKGISERLEGKNKTDAIERMKNLEDKLSDEWNGKYLPRFGYQQSESLYAVEPYNIPNNVFPLFWWKKNKDYSNRKTIFKRLI